MYHHGEMQVRPLTFDPVTLNDVHCVMPRVVENSEALFLMLFLISYMYFVLIPSFGNKG